MGRKQQMICAMLVGFASQACVKAQKNPDSKISVNPGDSGHVPQKDLDDGFEFRAKRLRELIQIGTNTIGSADQESSYWRMSLKGPKSSKLPATGEDEVTFYFKKKPTNVGPDIHIEFANGDEMVSLYLSSYASARASFADDSPGGENRAVKAFELLKKEVGRSKSPIIFGQLADGLKELARYLKSPTLIKKFEGVTPQGKACYVDTVTDHNGHILKVNVGYVRYKDSKQNFASVNFYLGLYKYETQVCGELEFDTTKQMGFSRKKFPYTMAVTYEWQTVAPYQSVGTLKGSQTKTGFIGGALLTGGSCETIKLTMCHDRAQIQRVTFGGGNLSLIPFLGATMYQSLAIDCRNLNPI